MDIYYGLWAQMRNWTINRRAVLVVAVCCVIFAVFMKLIGFRIIALFLQVINLILKGIFVILSGIFQIRVSDRSLRYWNSICNKFEKISAFFDKHKNQLRQPHKKIFGKMIVVYVILLVCIIVPGQLEGVLSTRYLDNISQVRRVYMRLEQIPLEKAKDYPPLFEPANEAGE